MSAQGPAAILEPLNRVERLAGRGLRERERKTRVKRRATRADAGVHETLIARLTRLHQVTFTRVDWKAIVEIGPVAPAVKRDALSSVAKRELAEYRPSILDSLLGLEAGKRRKLTAKVVEAAKADAEAYGRALEAANAHNRVLKLAPDVAALKADAIAEVLRAEKTLQAFRGAVEGFQLEARPGGRLIAIVDLLEYDALPDEACLSSPAGVASYAQIPGPERRQLQLANACSAALRAAAELLQVADVEAVEVVARLFRPGGLAEDEMETVLYVKVPMSALGKLDLQKVEAAPAVTALKARIDWDSSRGFAPVRIDDLGLADTRLASPA